MVQPDKRSYFAYANPFVFVLIITGMTLCHLGCFNRALVPHQKLGPLGSLFYYLAYTKPNILKVIYFAALSVHCLEGAYSLHLTKKKGIFDPTARFKWFVQTTLLGIGSLSLLLRYDPKHTD